MTQSILTPVLVLVCWTMVMWFWLYVTRIPAMKAIGLHRFQEKKDLDMLPRKVRQVADNYNHLHEQPVLFYALAFYSHLVGTADSVTITRTTVVDVDGDGIPDVAEVEEVDFSEIPEPAAEGEQAK